MAEELTPRQRVRLALEHQVTDRVPIAMICSGINPPARRALEQHLRRTRGVGVEQYLDRFLDVLTVQPDYVGPTLEPGMDIWGVGRAPVSYGEDCYDEIVYYPLAETRDPADLDRHRWPDPDWFDFEGFRDKLRAARADKDWCIITGHGNIFEHAWYMRGLERTLEDMVLRPQLARAMFERVCNYYCEWFRRALSAADGLVDLAFTAGDIGMQTGLMMSPKMWEELVRPYYERLHAVIHEFGVKVVYHTDGSVIDAIEGLIACGVDVLQALQFDAAGMDPALIKQRYGDRLCFEGGISVQQTLPFGTPEEVAREVRERIDVLGRGGGYILGPSHVIQAGTPPENIVTMFETAATHPVRA